MAVTEPDGPAESGVDHAFAAPVGTEAAAERWRAAEAKLYPLVVADPDLYMLVVQLVVEVRELLRAECATMSALLDASAAGVLTRCASAPKVQTEGFDPRIAFDAARVARLRELQQS